MFLMKQNLQIHDLIYTIKYLRILSIDEVLNKQNNDRSARTENWKDKSLCKNLNLIPRH